MSDAWLSPIEAALVVEAEILIAEAVRITNSQPQVPITRDSCERCGGKGCLQCGLEPFVRGAMSGQRARR
jgi:hypothetical protein